MMYLSLGVAMNPESRDCCRKMAAPYLVSMPIFCGLMTLQGFLSAYIGARVLGDTLVSKQIHVFDPVKLGQTNALGSAALSLLCMPLLCCRVWAKQIVSGSEEAKQAALYSSGFCVGLLLAVLGGVVGVAVEQRYYQQRAMSPYAEQALVSAVGSIVATGLLGVAIGFIRCCVLPFCRRQSHSPLLELPEMHDEVATIELSVAP